MPATKEKGFNDRNRPALAEDFVVPSADMDFVAFLRLMNSSPNAEIIEREVFAGSGGRRGNSHSLVYALEKAYDILTTRCRVDTICLLHVFAGKVTKKNTFHVLTELSRTIDRMFTASNSDASYRGKVRMEILKKPWHGGAP